MSEIYSKKGELLQTYGKYFALFLESLQSSKQISILKQNTIHWLINKIQINDTDKKLYLFDKPFQVTADVCSYNNNQDTSSNNNTNGVVSLSLQGNDLNKTFQELLQSTTSSLSKDLPSKALMFKFDVIDIKTKNNTTDSTKIDSYDLMLKMSKETASVIAINNSAFKNHEAILIKTIILNTQKHGELMKMKNNSNGGDNDASSVSSTLVYDFKFYLWKDIEDLLGVPDFDSMARYQSEYNKNKHLLPAYDLEFVKHK